MLKKSWTDAVTDEEVLKITSERRWDVLVSRKEEIIMYWTYTYTETSRVTAGINIIKGCAEGKN